MDFDFQVSDMTFADLHGLLSEKVKLQYIQLFEQTAMVICREGFTQLFDFFDRINEPIRESSDESLDFTQLNKASVVGTDIVRCDHCVNFFAYEPSAYYYYYYL